ncbi:MAG: putative nucleic acid-binding protein contains domain [Chthonomonadaceae bacterium]|nr:putative nucleic acid-binding protein contains domain [Chthonomonadaceae bacterium]
MARKTTMPTSIVMKRTEVFVDTGGWIAVAAEDDNYHQVATDYFESHLQAGTRFLTSDYVLDETLTRLRYDLGHGAALRFWQQIEAAQKMAILDILRVDEVIWSAAYEVFAQFRDQTFSFTDCTSFVLARSHSVDEVFAFDAHFAIFGFVIRPAR